MQNKALGIIDCNIIIFLVSPLTLKTLTKAKAIEHGMQTLRMDGARKVMEGLTTVAEVLRVTQSDAV